MARVAVGEPKAVTVEFPAAADDDVTVNVDSSRSGNTTGPFTATDDGDGKYSFTLTPALVAEVDELKLTFTGDISGVSNSLTEYAEVAGRHYFTVPEAKTIGKLGSTLPFTVTDAGIEGMRAAVEDQIEANCDTSFVARYVEERLSGNLERFLKLSEQYVLRLISVTEDGSELSLADDVDLDGRYLWKTSSTNSRFTAGHRNVVVKYEAGFSERPAEDLKRKAIEATRHNLAREERTGLPQTAVTLGTDIGTLRIAVAGLKQPFGLPEVDAVVLRWAQKVGVPIV